MCGQGQRPSPFHRLNLRVAITNRANPHRLPFCASVCFLLCQNKCMSKMSCLLIQCYFVLKLVSPAPLFSLSPGLHALHAEDETPGEVKRGAGMEFCSIYRPEIFLLERHTLFSLSLFTLRTVSHSARSLPLTSHLSVTCGHFTSFQDGLAVL